VQLRLEVAAGAVTVAVLVLLGAPLGLFWAAISPKVLDGFGENNAFFAADGYFLLASLLVGISCGVVAYSFTRYRGPGVAAGLAGGGILAALIADRVGARVRLSTLEDARPVSTSIKIVGYGLHHYVGVTAEPVYVGWAFAAVLTYGILVGFWSGAGPLPGATVSATWPAGTPRSPR